MRRVRLSLKRVRIKPKAKAPARKPALRKKFTDRNVMTLRSEAKQYMVWDMGTGAVKGLGILVSPQGTKSYRSYWYYEGSSKAHSRTIGRVGRMSLKAARAQCLADQTSAEQGINPAASDATKSDKFASLVEEFVQREQIGRKENVSADETRRVLLRDCADWHDRPVATIKPTEIQHRLELVRKGDGKKLKARPYLANALYGRLNTFFAWCAKPMIGKIRSSPMVGIDKPWDGAKRRERDWFNEGAPSDNAVKAIWSAAEKIGGTEGAYLKVLLLTGKRKSALANMKWQEVDENWYWNAPKPTKKYKRLHGIPLPKLAQRILHPRKASGYVFPGKDNGHIYVNGSPLQSKIIRASGMEDFFFHGIRHVIETKLGSDVKVLPHVRDLLLDHAPSRGSGANYDHGAYKSEMLAALELWADYVEKLVQPEGVALLR
ncbi:MAG: integrase arm-type DNA-binding domain-containing protein [Pseudolabrys sp.]|nr:integrase arm-type DNA-binding domain-containing protein [Pseudolabrys sp.]